MNHLIYHTKKKALRVPAGVHELTGKQLCAIAAIIHSGDNKLKASLKALRVLSKLNRLQFYFLNADIKLLAIEYVQWIFEPLNITDQLLPKYKNFYGPKAEFNNLTIAEFHFAEQYYAELQPKIKEDSQVSPVGGDLEGAEALHNLISVLYRVPKPGYDTHKDLDGDIRVPFNSNASLYYSKEVARWPAGVKYAILMYYDGCRQKIADDYPEVFTNGTSSGEDDGTGMYNVMVGLAGDKWGTFEEVEKMLLHTALLALTKIKKEQEDLERKYKSAS